MFKNNKKLHRCSIALLVLAFLVCMCFSLTAVATESEEEVSTEIVDVAAPDAEVENVLLIAPADDSAIAEDSVLTTGAEETAKSDKSNSEALSEFLEQTGVKKLINGADWKSIVMILISFVLMFLAIGKGFEPLLLLPIAFGIFMSNLPMGGTFEYFYEIEHW